MIFKKLAAINNKIEKLKKEKVELIKATVVECKHPIEAIYEKPVKNNGFLGVDRPWLICSLCGLTEEGWGCGYKELRHAEYKNLKIIDYDEWLKLSTIRIFQNGEKVYV